MRRVLRDVMVLPGGGRQEIACAAVTLDADGVVESIEPVQGPAQRVLAPPAVDLHFDVLRERRRPRATVELELERVVPLLDGELAAAGIGTVCVGARFEEEPSKGIRMADATALCALVERLAPSLSCDWLLHARVEVDEERAEEVLARALSLSSRVALVSVMDHSAERTRFADARAHRDYYAADWGLPVEAVETILERKRAAAPAAPARRETVARLAADRGLPLASHDDRTAADVRAAAALGAAIAEFPLTLDAARAARRAHMTTVLGAPNAVRGRSTSPGNLTVAEAVEAGLCDVLCSDYLPSALLQAPFSLAAGGQAPLAAAHAMVSDAPARAIGLTPAAIAVGHPLDAALIERFEGVPVAVGLWRGGRLVAARGAALAA
jgi:alpha-D-ribose 1-methylphosphonate 5-triphosphate diphosphatase